jgi:hypothetical protein
MLPTGFMEIQRNLNTIYNYFNKLHHKMWLTVLFKLHMFYGERHIVQIVIIQHQYLMLVHHYVLHVPHTQRTVQLINNVLVQFYVHQVHHLIQQLVLVFVIQQHLIIMAQHVSIVIYPIFGILLALFVNHVHQDLSIELIYYNVNNVHHLLLMLLVLVVNHVMLRFILILIKWHVFHVLLIQYSIFLQIDVSVQQMLLFFQMGYV